MAFTIRTAVASDYAGLETLVIESFEPITWQKTLDETIGLLNGRDWRQRWTARLRNIFRRQEVMVGELDGELAAMASGTVDCEAALGWIDVLAVARVFQGRGLGREMLRGMIQHLKGLDCQYVHLDC